MNNHKWHHGVVRFLVPSKNGISRYNLLNFYEKILNQIRETAYYEKEVDNICFKYSNITFEYFASIITCDPEFVKWFKLRVGDFEDIQKKEKKKDAPTYNGIYGEIPATSTFDLLDDDPTYLHPFIFLVLDNLCRFNL